MVNYPHQISRKIAQVRPKNQIELTLPIGDEL